MSKYTNKEIFTVHGRIEKTMYSTSTGKQLTRNTFVPFSQKYLWDGLNRIVLGTPVSATFSKHIPTRSEQQLKYHMVLMGYLGDFCGNTVDEQHDIMMRIVFGTKKKVYRGKEYEIRYSVSNEAKFPKEKMVELIQRDLQELSELGVTVPTAQELGYLPTTR